MRPANAESITLEETFTVMALVFSPRKVGKSTVRITGESAVPGYIAPATTRHSRGLTSLWGRDITPAALDTLCLIISFQVVARGIQAFGSQAQNRLIFPGVSKGGRRQDIS